MTARTILILIIGGLSLGALLIVHEHRAPIPTTKVELSHILDSRSYALEPILHIDMQSEGTLYIVQEEGEPTLRIDADKALMPYLEFTATNSTLKLTRLFPKNTEFSVDAPEYYLFVPDIASISARGIAHIISHNTLQVNSLDVNCRGSATIELAIKVKQLDIQSHGAGAITLSGSATEQYIQLYGTTRYDAFSLNTQISSIDASGAFIAYIWATEQLLGTISGAGKVILQGDPEVSVKKQGTAEIKKITTKSTPPKINQ